MREVKEARLNKRKKKMEKKIEIQKETEQRCPKCKSSDLDFQAYEFIDEQIKQIAICNKCNFGFTYWADKPLYWEVFGRL
ncbi:unnamed protein product [marine sediment metagenome]|uniref:Uncharacterized protein n=1 Tax=marine sediment metagenome TaxID=412755 RepID=X0ZM88_9ZZZZ